jgi:2-iminobutanoate/2-iminopropanoate deaminase
MHKAIQTVAAPKPKGHYSRGVRVGNFLFISGQPPVVPDGQLVTGTIAEESTQALENIRAIVEAAGGTIADLVQCIIYISDISLWEEVNGVYGRFFADVHVLRARAVVPVKELHCGAHIEIQAVAVLKDELW